MSRPSWKLNRRTVLRGSGALLALPVLDVMRPKRAFAADTPRRMVYWYIANGVSEAHWTPSSAGPGYDLPYSLEPLGSIAGLQDQVSVISGVNGRASYSVHEGPHSRATTACLTANTLDAPYGTKVGGPSADQVVANALRNQGINTSLKYLALGTEEPKTRGCDGKQYSSVYCNTISWAAPTLPIQKEYRPASLFETLTGERPSGAAMTDTNPTQQPSSIWQNSAVQQSVLHHVNEDAKRLRKRLGIRDRAKLDEYLTSVEELERRVRETSTTQESTDATGALRCSLPDNLPSSANYQETIDLMVDLMFWALECDITRVVSFMFGNSTSQRVYSHLGISGRHHAMSHHKGNQTTIKELAAIARYEIEVFSRFLAKLHRAQDADGNSMLRNSMVFLSSDCLDGNSHQRNPLPVLVAGSGGGALRTGQHVDFGGNENMGNLHLTLMRAAGITQGSFGKYGTKVLSELLA